MCYNLKKLANETFLREENSTTILENTGLFLDRLKQSVKLLSPLNFNIISLANFQLIFLLFLIVESLQPDSKEVFLSYEKLSNVN